MTAAATRAEVRNVFGGALRDAVDSGTTDLIDPTTGRNKSGRALSVILTDPLINPCATDPELFGNLAWQMPGHGPRHD